MTDTAAPPTQAPAEASGCLSPWPGDACPRPEAHATCTRCFSWRACDDDACDHPACESARWRSWCAAYEAEHPDAHEEVLVYAGEPYDPAEGSAAANTRGYRAILGDDHPGRPRDAAPDAKVERAAAALLRALERAEWVNVYGCRGVPGEHALDAEMLLWSRGYPLEARPVIFRTRAAIAHDAEHGLEPRGGLYTHQLRLASRDLADAPPDTQGSLF